LKLEKGEAKAGREKRELAKTWRLKVGWKEDLRRSALETAC